MVQSVLLDTVLDLTGEPRFITVPFDVPEHTSRLRVTGRFATTQPAQIPLALADSRKQLRGMQVNEFSRDSAEHILETSAFQAGKGCLSGPVHPGKWHVIIYCRYLPETVAYHLQVTAESGTDTKRMPFGTAQRPPEVLDHRKRWYCGELHMHSSESTGKASAEEVIQAAQDHKLDFIALTDHFSVSHWDIIDNLDHQKPPLVIKSMELSGERGHANLHGLHSWINPFVDCDGELLDALGLAEWSMNHAAQAAHEQGGLFCINHPISGRVAWRYEDVDCSLADLLEVVCLPDGPPSFLYPVLWDRFLLDGYRMTGIGSSDSLDERSIIDSLKRGRVYTSLGDTRMDMHVELTSPGEAPQSVPMGCTARIRDDAAADLVVQLWDHPKGNLFIIKDGLLVGVLSVQGSQAHGDDREVLRFPLSPPNTKGGKASYVRSEFHEETVKPYYVIMAHRDHASIRAISNPVWLTRRDHGN